MKTTISTTIEIALREEAYNRKIPLNDALEFGIKFLLAEKDGVDYPENSLSKKIEKLVENLNNKCSEMEKLEEKLNIYTDPLDDEEELKEVFTAQKDE